MEWLEPAEEDALHATRLLSFEDKLYKRIARRVLGADSQILENNPRRLPEATAASTETDDSLAKPDLGKWTEETLLEFAAFDSNVARVQFLFRSNALERERYAQEKDHIVQTAQSVRDNNSQLRVELSAAQAALDIRKEYDKLTEQITSNRALKARDEQHAAIEKLTNEIAELERECGDYARTWTERREQFGRIVDEGTAMLRLIRDEKEEAERQEGMDGVEEGSTSRPASRAATPKPGEESATPQLDPSRLKSSLQVKADASNSASAKNSRATTPAPQDDEQHQQQENTRMGDADADIDALEEGEAEDSADDENGAAHDDDAMEEG